MRIDKQRDVGNIDSSTDIVNEGEYVGYASADLGGFTIEFTRGRKSAAPTWGSAAKVYVDGPFIASQCNEMFASVDVLDLVTEAIDTWDYIEAAETPEFDPERGGE